jgi:hypothetical protein
MAPLISAHTHFLKKISNLSLYLGVGHLIDEWTKNTAAQLVTTKNPQIGKTVFLKHYLHWNFFLEIPSTAVTVALFT